jgi:hypothetical protein
MEAVKDDMSGGILLKNPAWMEASRCGAVPLTQTCFSIKRALKSPIEHGGHCASCSLSTSG